MRANDSDLDRDSRGQYNDYYKDDRYVYSSKFNFSFLLECSLFIYSNPNFYPLQKTPNFHVWAKVSK